MRNAIVMIVLLFVGPSVLAHADDKELLELKKEVAELRLEIAELRLQVKQLKDAIEQGGHAADDEQQAEEEEQKEEQRTRTYEGGDAIMRAVPEEHEPKREGWKGERLDLAAAWYEKNIPGNRYRALHRVKFINVRTDLLTKERYLEVKLESTRMRYMSWDMQEQVSALRIDLKDKDPEQLAKQYAVGRLVRVEGEIDRIRWSPQAPTSPLKAWRPTTMFVYLKQE